MNFDLTASPGHQAQSPEALHQFAHDAAAGSLAPPVSSDGLRMQSATNLFSLFDQLGDAVVHVDHDWRIVMQTASSARFLHQPAAPGSLLWETWPGMSAELAA